VSTTSGKGLEQKRYRKSLEHQKPEQGASGRLKDLYNFFNPKPPRIVEISTIEKRRQREKSGNRD
jgi:hypothetical protein